jgi:hypothetical protein
MSEWLWAYIGLHGLTTIGAVLTFLIRIEHRLTRLETKMENFEKHRS